MVFYFSATGYQFWCLRNMTLQLLRNEQQVYHTLYQSLFLHEETTRVNYFLSFLVSITIPFFPLVNITISIILIIFNIFFVVTP